jgi:DNA-binding Lrp family transcriptional regulator
LKRGIIKEFYTAVNTGKFGIDSYYLFLQLKNISGKQERELVEKINSLDYIGWSVDGIGRWDAIILIYAASAAEFNHRLEEISSICGNYLHEYSFTTLINAEYLGYGVIEKSNSTHFKHTEKTSPLEIEELDKKLLLIMSQNARIPLVDIAQKLNTSVQVVNYRLKRLIKKDIIEGFKPRIDIHKIGFQWHLILMQFKGLDDNNKKRIFSFCENHKNIYYVSSIIGRYNLMMDIHVETIEEFRETIFELKETFPDLIKTIELFNVFEEHKINYFPVNLQ